MSEPLTLPEKAGVAFVVFVVAWIAGFVGAIYFVGYFCNHGVDCGQHDWDYYLPHDAIAATGFAALAVVGLGILSLKM